MAKRYIYLLLLFFIWIYTELIRFFYYNHHTYNAKFLSDDFTAAHIRAEIGIFFDFDVCASAIFLVCVVQLFASVNNFVQFKAGTRFVEHTANWTGFTSVSKARNTATRPLEMVCDIFFIHLITPQQRFRNSGQKQFYHRRLRAYRSRQ